MCVHGEELLDTLIIGTYVGGEQPGLDGGVGHVLVWIGDGAENETEGVFGQRGNDGVEPVPLVVDVAHPEPRLRQAKPGGGAVGPEGRKLESRGVMLLSRHVRRRRQLRTNGRRGIGAAIL